MKTKTLTTTALTLALLTCGWSATAFAQNDATHQACKSKLPLTGSGARGTASRARGRRPVREGREGPRSEVVSLHRFGFDSSVGMQADRRVAVE